MQSRIVVAAPVADVWAVVGDPRQLARWWPGVSRVEAVDGGAFTAVMAARDGRALRLDYVCAAEEPVVFSWELTVAGSPFARVLSRWATSVRLSEVGGGTSVEIVERQELRGSYRLGGFLRRRPARRRVAGAAEGLRALFAER